ncbi:MAG: MOSC domain-containing protein [Proteobacteria bacterium]|nr:MOSC domain-containing protein [Pseudomonadota bacterium]
MPKVLAVCRSEKKGTRKEAGTEGVLRENHGLVEDAHACPEGHRQVSLLAMESIEKMKKLGYAVGPGDFAENLTTEGINLCSLPVSTRLHIGKDIVLEITQIGKECHAGCAIMQETGKCIMPREGIFARVIRGGRVSAGDRIKIVKSEKLKVNSKQ